MFFYRSGSFRCANTSDPYKCLVHLRLPLLAASNANTNISKWEKGTPTDMEWQLRFIRYEYSLTRQVLSHSDVPTHEGRLTNKPNVIMYVDVEVLPMETASREDVGIE
jgi:hypothetical protein